MTRRWGAAPSARVLLFPAFVQILEARFHPRTKLTGDFVVVGTVKCDGRRSVIAPALVSARLVKPFAPDSLLTKLEFLVTSAFPDPFTELVRLRSDYWSFVQVEHGAAIVDPPVT